MSLGFMIELCETIGNIREKKDLHKEEQRYFQLKDIYPFVQSDFKNKIISRTKYDEFIKEYRGLEEKYGCNY